MGAGSGSVELCLTAAFLLAVVSADSFDGFDGFYQQPFFTHRVRHHKGMRRGIYRCPLQDVIYPTLQYWTDWDLGEITFQLIIFCDARNTAGTGVHASHTDKDNDESH